MKMIIGLIFVGILIGLGIWIGFTILPPIISSSSFWITIFTFLGFGSLSLCGLLFLYLIASNTINSIFWILNLIKEIKDNNQTDKKKITFEDKERIIEELPKLHDKIQNLLQSRLLDNNLIEQEQLPVLGKPITAKKSSAYIPEKKETLEIYPGQYWRIRERLSIRIYEK